MVEFHIFHLIYSSWHTTGEKIAKLFSEILEVMNSLMSLYSMEYIYTY